MPDSSPIGPRAHAWARAGLAGLLTFLLVSTSILLLATRGEVARQPGIDSLRQLAHRDAAYAVALAAAVATIFVFREKTPRYALHSLVAALVLTTLFGFAHPLGRHVGLFATALLFAFLAGHAPRHPVGLRHPDRVLPVLGFVATLVPMCIFAMHRHAAFGSGSWDMGCYVHNAYLVSQFLPTISTVLGGADFLGDHFSVGLYLYAPYFWIAGSGYGLILLQSANLACTTPAIYGIARLHGASPAVGFAIAISTGLSFGLQSAAFFDVHSITLGFGFFAAALWAIEARRLVLASVLIFVFSLFKESIGLYIGGLGAWLVIRGLGTSARDRGFGAGWMAFGAVWFVVVNRVFVPWFRARGAPPEYHETFADFGPTVFEAALAMLAEPMTTFLFMFDGDEKLMSQFTTFAHPGWLTLLSPSVFVAGAPLFVERFLSSKASMWHMGFHYAAPLCLYAGWGAARALGRVEAWTQKQSLIPRASASVVVFISTAAVLTLAFGYRHPANFLKWNEPYYSTQPKQRANAAAVEWVQENAPNAAVAAQNHLLPHVASRQHIYRLGRHEKADFVLLSLGEDAWPYGQGFPKRFARRLDRDPRWELVFDENDTRVYRRNPGAGAAEGRGRRDHE